MTDYRIYDLSQKEKLNYYLLAFFVLFSVGMLFYRSPLFALLCLPGAIPCEKLWAARKARMRRDVLLEGFRDALYAISAAIAAGRQMPEAIADAAEQVRFAYGSSAPIAAELNRIAALYEGSHGSIEALLIDFGSRSGLEEIQQFAGVCQICRRSGGDLEAVALTSANLILDRIRFRREVQMLTAQKKLDIVFLISMPLLILLFLNLTAPDYLAILYAGLPGRCIMTACLLTIAAALGWGLRLIEVML
ncbi:MAG TPA: hypothetical protein DF480_04290 [Clostridiales bacterium]|nr:hypothetical protein [Clostridiales bacterium]